MDELQYKGPSETVAVLHVNCDSMDEHDEFYTAMGIRLTIIVIGN